MKIAAAVVTLTALAASVVMYARYIEVVDRMDGFALSGRCRELALALNRPGDTAQRLTGTRDICLGIFRENGDDGFGAMDAWASPPHEAHRGRPEASGTGAAQ